ncbi:hypothetical protein JB92DRAFT_2933726 [Gautieria morchelliformis]|nr:hypothetical protein JB92DRAFT_2933726 [Gautieria morchelliformis]
MYGKQGREGRMASAFSDDDSESDSDAAASDDPEDNVPLAQRIPGALQAQKTIRIQDKAEKERRRKERHRLRQKSQPRLVRAVYAYVYPLTPSV